MGKGTSVRIGVFIPTKCQLLDQACVDILASMSHEYISLLQGMVPGPVVDLVPGATRGRGLRGTAGVVKGAEREQGNGCADFLYGGFAAQRGGAVKGEDVWPRGFQDMIREKWEKDIVQKGVELRWVQAGNFWSSGGVINGNDLVAAYARHSKHFPGLLLKHILEMLDVGDWGQNNAKGHSALMFTMGFNLFGAWLMSFWPTN